MRWSEEWIEQVLQANDIVDLIGQYTQLKPSGNNLMGLCPFPDHREKTPSFSVSQQKQLYHCFGCKKSGNIVTFLRDYNGLSFRDAIEFLAKRAGIPLPTEEDSRLAPSHDTQKTKKEILSLYQEAQAFYSAQLQLLLRDSHSTPTQYLQKRQIPLQAVERFGLGYAPAEWDQLYQHLRKKKLSVELAIQAHLLRQKNDHTGVYDFFRDRLLFPIRNPLGQTLAFGGRILGEGQPKYLNSPEHPAFHKGQTLYGLKESARAIRATGRAILVEGYMDVLRLHTAGIENVIAPMGTALTPEQARLLKRYTSEVVVLFDGDEAGQQATEKALGILLAAGFWVYGISLPEGLDPDDFVIKYGGSALSSALEKAPDLLQHWVQSQLPAKHRLSPTEKSQWLTRLQPLLHSIPDSRLRQLYLEEFSWKLGIPPAQWKIDSHTTSRVPAAHGNKAFHSQASKPPEPLSSSAERHPSYPPGSSPKEKPSADMPLPQSSPLTEAPPLTVLIKTEELSPTERSLLAALLSFPEEGLALVENFPKLLSPAGQQILHRVQQLARQEGAFFDKVQSLVVTYMSKPELLFLPEPVYQHLKSQGPSAQKSFFQDHLKHLQMDQLKKHINQLKWKLRSQPSDKDTLSELSLWLERQKELLKSSGPLIWPSELPQ
jgi:DNA primase